MLAQGLISWWYIDGYKLFVKKLWKKLGDTADFFSIGSLLKTLFAPYRQIAANETGVSFDDKMFALIDRFVSRFVGGVARIGIVLAGIVVITLQFIVSILSFIVWPLLPMLPILFVMLTVAGVTL